MTRSGSAHGLIALIQLVSKVRSLVLIPLFLRGFGAAEYGIWVQVTLAVQFGTGIAQGGLHTTLLRYLPGSDLERRREIFWNGLAWVAVASTLMSGLGVLVSVPLASALGLPRSMLLAASALVIVRSIVQFASNRFRADGRAYLFSALENVPLLLEMGVVVLASVQEYSLTWTLILLTALESSFALVVTWRALDGLRYRRPSWPRMTMLLSYSLPTVPVNIGQFALAFGDRYIVGSLLGPAAVGVYSAAYGLAQVPALVNRPLIVTLITRLARLWNSGDFEGARVALRKYVQTYTLLSVPLAVGIGFFGEGALTHLTGSKAPEWTVSLLLSISIGSLLFGYVQLFLHSYHLTEKMRSSAWVVICAASLNTVGNLVLIPAVGLLGAGLATTIGYGVGMWLTYRYTARELGPPMDGRFVAKVAVSCLPMIAIWSFFPGTGSLLSFVAAVIAAGVAYIVIACAATGVSPLKPWRMFDVRQQSRSPRTLVGASPQDAPETTAKR